MAQFDVYHNINKNTHLRIPYLLDIQCNLFSELITTVVVPLVAKEDFKKTVKYLNPVFKIQDSNYVMLTPELAGISKKILGKKVTSLAAQRQEIIQALDFLITGF